MLLVSHCILGLYGHTSVYHSLTESLYVFGGVSYDTEHVAPSNYLYAFHYPSSQWFRLPPDNKVNAAKIRVSIKFLHDLRISFSLKIYEQGIYYRLTTITLDFLQLLWNCIQRQITAER